MDYLKVLSARNQPTPANAPVKGRTDMILAKSGAYTFKTSDKDYVRRCLMLGTTSNSFYYSSEESSKEFILFLMKVVEDSPTILEEEILYAAEGRTINQSTPILALVFLSTGDAVAKAGFKRIFPKVIRTASNLYEFLAYTKKIRGQGRLIGNAINDWLESKSTKDLTYQFLKYRSRNGFSARDVLRLKRPKTTDADRNALYKYLTQGEHLPEWKDNESLKQIYWFEFLKSNPTKAKEAIEGGNLSHEMVLTVAKMDKPAFEALVPKLPIMAMIRSLGSLTSKKIFDSLDMQDLVCDKLTNLDELRVKGIHPIQLLKALKTYSKGHGVKGSLVWRPEQRIVSALSKAVGDSFEFLKPTNARIAVFVDRSGSMQSSCDDMGVLSCFEAGMIIGAAIYKTEPRSTLGVFSYEDDCCYVSLSKQEAYESFLKVAFGGGTDVSLPIKKLLKDNHNVDAIVLVTDNESWSGNHTFQLVAEYRKKINKDVKVIYITLVPNKLSLAEPEDELAFNIAGFDPSIPSLIAKILE